MKLNIKKKKTLQDVRLNRKMINFWVLAVTPLHHTSALLIIFPLKACNRVFDLLTYHENRD